MKISRRLAQKIVDTIKSTLNYNVNFMNEKGIIVASTDANRINNFHEGSTICLKQQSPLFIESDNQYIGSRRGINTPIFFDDTIIGVIGMSGDQEVLKYAEILKTMTEILLKESYLNEISFQKREKNRLIVNSIIFSLEVRDLEFFPVDSQRLYRVAVGYTAKENQYAKIESIIDYPFTVDQNNVTIIIPENENISHSLKLLSERTGMTIGVGFATNDINKLPDSYQAAKKSLNWLNRFSHAEKIVYFENLDIGLILSDIKPESSSFFVKAVFKNINEDQLNNLYTLFKSFAKHNGSIKNISEELFIHKNTIQYQLNKLKKLTGYDARIYNEFSVLNLAFALHYGR